MGAPAASDESSIFFPSRIPVLFSSAAGLAADLQGPRLTGFYHPPSGPRVRAQAVVICYPLGHEAMSVHRTFRHLAERLAASGFPTLRFDYDGTGDSPAASEGPARIAAWLASIQAAVGEIRQRTQTDRVALVATGFGATLAAAAAANLGGVESLVLWAPVVSGRAYARALRAFRLFKYSKAGPPPRTDGGEEIAGYLFARETLTEMASLDLLTLNAPARRALIVAGSDNPDAEAKLAAALQENGAEVRTAPDFGYARMLRDDPYDSLVPEAALEKIVSWLGESDPALRPAPPEVPSVPGSYDVFSKLALPGSAPLRETQLTFGDGNLFGILTHAPAPNPERPAVIFLNVGANTHVGPHRMNVELARRVAATGYPAFRMDAAGLGESLPAPGTRENRIYTLDAVADVKAAMAAIESASGTKQFVLVGLCSGAYLAFHTAVNDPRVVGQILLSPYAFEWKEGDPVTPTERKGEQAYRSTRFYARAALDPRAWHLVLKGEVDVAGIGGAMLERAQTQVESALPALTARLRRTLPPQTEVERSFRRLGDRGVKTLMVLSYEDGGLDMIARYLGRDARRLRGESGFELRILHNVDHTFTTLDSQAQLERQVSGYLASRFA